MLCWHSVPFRASLALSSHLRSVLVRVLLGTEPFLVMHDGLDLAVTFPVVYCCMHCWNTLSLAQNIALRQVCVP